MGQDMVSWDWASIATAGGGKLGEAITGEDYSLLSLMSKKAVADSKAKGAEQRAADAKLAAEEALKKQQADYAAGKDMQARLASQAAGAAHAKAKRGGRSLLGTPRTGSLTPVKGYQGKTLLGQ